MNKELCINTDECVGADLFHIDSHTHIWRCRDDSLRWMHATLLHSNRFLSSTTDKILQFITATQTMGQKILFIYDKSKHNYLSRMLEKKSLLAAAFVNRNWLLLCQSDKTLKERIHSQLCNKRHKSLSYENNGVETASKYLIITSSKFWKKLLVPTFL